MIGSGRDHAAAVQVDNMQWAVRRGALLLLVVGALVAVHAPAAQARNPSGERFALSSSCAGSSVYHSKAEVWHSKCAPAAAVRLDAAGMTAALQCVC